MNCFFLFYFHFCYFIVLQNLYCSVCVWYVVCNNKMTIHTKTHTERINVHSVIQSFLLYSLYSSVHEFVWPFLFSQTFYIKISTHTHTDCTYSTFANVTLHVNQFAIRLNVTQPKYSFIHIYIRIDTSSIMYIISDSH